jgi:tetratricopeptide (TPR) repeat protein
MADRYLYLPSIGIFTMLVWGITSLIKSEETRKKILFPAGIAVIAILAVLTWQQCGYWKNSITLFSHAVQVTKDNFLAHTNLGIALFEKGKIEEAIEHYNKAIGLNPAYSYPYNSRGIIYRERGRYQLAIEDFNNAIRINPDFAEFYYNRGTAYYDLGQYQLAIKDCDEAIILKPSFDNAYMGRGAAYLNQGNNTLGCHDAQKACALGNCKLLASARDIGLCR